MERTTKSGKVQRVNLRDRLFELEFIHTQSETTATLRYVGSCRNDGTLLRPTEVLYCLEQVCGQELELYHTHRQALLLNGEESAKF